MTITYTNHKGMTSKYDILTCHPEKKTSRRDAIKDLILEDAWRWNEERINGRIPSHLYAGWTYELPSESEIESARLFFERKAKRYGLVRELKDMGII